MIETLKTIAEQRPPRLVHGSRTIDPTGYLSVGVDRIKTISTPLLRFALKISLNMGALTTLLLTNALLRHSMLDDDNGDPTWFHVYVSLSIFAAIGMMAIFVLQALSGRYGRASLTAVMYSANALVFGFLAYGQEYCDRLS